MSHAMCHVSHVTCHVSRVTCHLSHVTFFLNIFYLKKKMKKIRRKNVLNKIGQSGGASCRRVCYQRGLPRLVFLGSHYILRMKIQLLDAVYKSGAPSLS